MNPLAGHVVSAQTLALQRIEVSMRASASTRDVWPCLNGCLFVGFDANNWHQHERPRLGCLLY
jgi:hypothetical protein